MSIERYVVTVWPYSPGSNPDEVDPIVQLCIDMDEEGEDLLNSRLYALLGEDYIGNFDITMTPFRIGSMDGVLAAIVGDDAAEHGKVITDLWNKYQRAS